MKEQFEKLLSENQTHIVVEEEIPVLISFTVIDQYHYEAEYILNSSELIIQVKYLLIWGPSRYWFTIVNMQSHTKALQRTGR